MPAIPWRGRQIIKNLSNVCWAGSPFTARNGPPLELTPAGFCAVRVPIYEFGTKISPSTMQSGLPLACPAALLPGKGVPVLFQDFHPQMAAVCHFNLAKKL